jgi:hypothetical protein
MQVWLRAHPKAGDAGDPKQRLSTEQFAHIVDVLEKESGRIDGFVSTAVAESKCCEQVCACVVCVCCVCCGCVFVCV